MLGGQIIDLQLITGWSITHGYKFPLVNFVSLLGTEFKRINTRPVLTWLAGTKLWIKSHHPKKKLLPKADYYQSSTEGFQFSNQLLLISSSLFSIRVKTKGLNHGSEPAPIGKA